MKRLLAALIRRPRTLAVAGGFLVALAALPAHAQTCPPPAGLVSWWRLGETSGTAVADTPNPNTFGPNPGTTSAPIGSNNGPKSLAGFVGNGLSFFASNRVTVPSLRTAFGSNSSFTIGAWIKGVGSPIVSNYSNNTGFLVAFANNKLRLDIGTGSASSTQLDGPAITPGAWTFIAVVVDRTTIATPTATLYTGPAGGPLTSSGPLSLPNAARTSSGAPFIIGGCIAGPNSCNTIIDEVQLYGRPLESRELQSIVDSCQPTPTSGMTWRWGGVSATTGTVTVGCGPSEPRPCNASVGDQSCTDPLPLLCIKSNPVLPKPKSVVETPYYYMWSGGIVATTAPVAPAMPPIGSSLTRANERCADEFGAGWRVAEFHDGAQGKGGWNFQAYGNVGDPNPKPRFWVHINDQPKGTCFAKK